MKEKDIKIGNFAAVFPHSDDFTIFAGGTIMKMIALGWTGYFIRLTNDEKDSKDLTIGETICTIERETQLVAKSIGIKKVFDFNYKNHYLNPSEITEIRHRLIFLFRLLKIDMVISFDPWSHYEENPDHSICGTAVEQACWMAGRSLDLPELSEAGLIPHKVEEKYYVSRTEQALNLFINIEAFIERKRLLLNLHKTPLQNMYFSYCRSCAMNNRSVLSFQEFIDWYFIEKLYTPREGLRYYEAFHYIKAGDY